MEEGAIFAVKMTADIQQQVRTQCVEQLQVLMQSVRQCDDVAIKQMLQRVVFEIKLPDLNREITRKPQRNLNTAITTEAITDISPNLSAR